MVGYSRQDCIYAQRQQNKEYYDEEKRKRQRNPAPPRTDQTEPEVKRLKSAADYNREQNKSPELSNDEIVGKYFGSYMAKSTIDGDDETYEARVNQADMER